MSLSCGILPNMNIKQITFWVLLVFMFAGCNAQSTEKNTVDLYRQYSADKGYHVFYRKDADTPYSGRLVSESGTDKVIVNFRNGKMDGFFLRLNSSGDTLELRKYNQGAEIYTINYQYKDGKLVERKKHEKESGDKQDFEIFSKALNLIKHKQFNELDNYLNPLHAGYENTFLKLESLFGTLQDFKIKAISKAYIEHQNAEHLSAEIELSFQNKNIEAGFLIVEYPDELKGEGFSFPSFDYALIKDDKAAGIINSLNNNDVDALIKMTQFTEQHREKILKNFEQIDEISGPPVFLNSHFDFFNEIRLIKDYLVTVGQEKQVLALTYKINKKNSIALMQFRFLPYRKPYMVMHKIR